MHPGRLCLDSNNSCHLVSLRCVLGIKALFTCILQFITLPGLGQPGHMEHSAHCCAHSQGGIINMGLGGHLPYFRVFCPHRREGVEGSLGRLPEQGEAEGERKDHGPRDGITHAMCRERLTY